MIVLHARVHRARYRELVAAEGLALDAAPEPVLFACPRCGDEFFLDLDTDTEPWDVEEAEWQAVTRLDGECPDHAHRFVIEDE